MKTENPSPLAVDSGRCIRCGLCAVACPRGLIELREDLPEIFHADLCVVCGHCVAVCPTQALDHQAAPLAGQSPFPAERPAGEQMFSALRSRRSIRKFKEQLPDRQLVLQLMEIARFAPTGGNSQGVSYTILENRSTLQNLTRQTIAWLEQQADNGVPAARNYRQYVQMYRERGLDSILRNAPCLIMAHADATFARGRENTLFSLAYVEALAPSLGLGSCWAGLMEAAAFAGFAPVLDLLAVPAGKQLTGLVMLGLPDYTFQRMPDRRSLDLVFRG